METKTEVYRLLILGDYRAAAVLDASMTVSMNDSTESLRPFTDAADSVAVSLAVPIPDANASYPTDQEGRGISHRKISDATFSGLKSLGVHVVNLSNPRIMDFGSEGLEATFRALTQIGVNWFGAGLDLNQAKAPYRINLPDRVGGGAIHLHGSTRVRKGVNDDEERYASTDSSGCFPLREFSVPHAHETKVSADTFQVALPYWGDTFEWRDEEQYRLAHRFMQKDYDLVLGHGSQSIQEVHRKLQRWIVYGIGDGVSNPSNRSSQDRSNERGEPFYSFRTLLEVHLKDQRRWLTLKLYPVYSRGLQTDFGPGPVSGEDFLKIVDSLASRPLRPWRFDNPAQSAGVDDLGRYLALDLGHWEIGKKPARIDRVVEGGDPNDWPLRSAGVEVEDKVLELNKQLGAGLLALGAEGDGGSVTWLAWDTALVESRGKRFLAKDYRAHESVVGSAIVQDKLLTAELLEGCEIPTPRTYVVRAPEEAVRVAGTLPGPVVVKPRGGMGSKGVSTNLTTAEEIRDAFTVARNNGSQVIVQQQVEIAEEMRIMASSKEAVAVNIRVFPHVMGDGVSTISQLIEDKNKQRSLNPALRKRFIPVDLQTRRQLKRIGLGLDSVLKLGEIVTVRTLGGISVGADTFQNLEGTSLELRRLARDAIAAVPGLRFGGVDVIIERGTRNAFVLEINDYAGYGSAQFPTYGNARDIGAKVWELRLDATASENRGVPNAAKMRSATLPVIDDTSILDGEGIASFIRLLANWLQRKNYTVKSLNSRLLVISSPRGHQTWVTRTGLTVADRSVVRRVMLRHDWVSRLLDIADIPRSRSRVVETQTQLRRFLSERTRTVFLFPTTTPWTGGPRHVASRDEALDLKPIPSRMWIQSRPAGRRVRVLASRDSALAVTRISGERPIGGDQIAAVGMLAVRAVRAVPELRWAAVDIVVRPINLTQGSARGMLVEGMTLVPQFSAESLVIAGNLDDFFQFIIGEL